MGGTPEARVIAAKVVEHYRRERRDLPWRRTRDPYAVWVSEIMCQQTRVATVVPYYERWLERFPSVEALAAAPIDDVLAAWTGLGYYRRARNLHRGAAEVVARYGGVVPGDAAALRSLPGVGRYTAGAIASIAFDAAEPLVDGNVARVLARLYALDGDVRSRAVEKQLWELAAELVPATAPGDFNQGLMELGATVCTPRSPRCESCPVETHCRARAEGREHELPVMPARVAAADRALIDVDAAWIERGGKLLVGRRNAGGLYGGLWELPQATERAKLGALLGLALEFFTEAPVWEQHQVLSHRRLRVKVWPARARGRARPTDDSGYDRLMWSPIDATLELGISSATRSILEQHREDPSWQQTTKSSRSSSKVTSASSKASRSSATARAKTKTSTARRGARPKASPS